MFIASDGTPLDATVIVPGLAVGSMPAPGPAVREAGFSVLVLTAAQYQPPEHAFPGVRLVRVPLQDSEEERAVGASTMASLERVARRLADSVTLGQNVLITCLEGRNRSTLLTAMVLRRLSALAGKPMSGREAIRIVQTLRPWYPERPDRPTFSNRLFVRYLLRS